MLVDATFGDGWSEEGWWQSDYLVFVGSHTTPLSKEINP